MTKLALTLAAVVSLGFLASPANASTCVGGVCVSGPFFSAELDEAVTCQVKEIEVLAKTAADCTTLGGTVKPAPEKAAEKPAEKAAAPAAEEHKEEAHPEGAKH